jgi:hypothetical protein
LRPLLNLIRGGAGPGRIGLNDDHHVLALLSQSLRLLLRFLHRRLSGRG